MSAHRINIQPRGFVAHALKQAAWSNSQFAPITNGGAVGATCWVPNVGGGAPIPRSLTHKANAVWQLLEHAVWAILFFGMGVKLPAKLAWIDAKRIIIAALSFI